jgi:4-hydroxy-3-polyprenylbenzoate decarboxylase
MTSAGSLAFTLRLPLDLQGLSLVKAIKERWQQVRPLPFQQVATGPVADNVFRDKDVDLFSLPVPRLHELDGGRYLGTACVVIMRDPDSGWINIGTYRVMQSDARTCTIHIVKGRHGWNIRNKYWQKNMSCPVVIAIGGDPLLYLMSSMELPWNENEMEWAGGWRGEPLAVMPGPVTGLPVPADAEIAVEGFMPPGKVLPEGPFGEWRGFYSKPGIEEPVIDVAALMHRHHPIMVASVPGIPPSDTTYPRGIFRAALVWHQLEKADVPGITGCWIVPWGGDRPTLVVSLKQLYPGHSRQVGMMAACCPAFNYGGVIVMVVDSDIDISSLEQIFWALSTRFRPEQDIHMIPEVWGNPVFRGGSSFPLGLSSRVVFDATVPWENLAKMPPLVRPSEDLARRIRKKWQHILDS